MHSVLQTQLFIQKGAIFLGTNEQTVDYLSIREFQSALQDTFQNYLDIDSLTFEKTLIDYSKVIISVSYIYPYRNLFKSDKKFQYEIDPSQPFTEPFDIKNRTSIKKFFSEVNAFQIFFYNITISQPLSKVCWDIQINYIYEKYSFIQASMITNGGTCMFTNSHQNENSNRRMLFNNLFNDSLNGYSYAGLQLVIMGLAVASLVLNIRYIEEVIELYTKQIFLANRKFKIGEKNSKSSALTTLKMILMEQRPWNRLKFREKLLFFDLYLPIKIVGNILEISCSMIILLEPIFRADALSNSDEVFVGFACFFQWISMVKYLEYDKKMHILASVVEASVVPLMLCIVNFLPVFFAYTFLGLCLFNDSSRFQDLRVKGFNDMIQARPDHAGGAGVRG